MTQAERDGSVDVLVVSGSGAGIGHFHPIAAFAQQLTDPSKIVFTVNQDTDNPVRQKLIEDGMRFVEWQPSPEHGLLSRSFTVLRQQATRRWAPWLAARGTDLDLPGRSSRFVFALASAIRPLEASRRSTGEQLNKMLRDLRPRLVLAEGYDEWLSVLCGHRGIPWARYTTGPVSEPHPSRPVQPAGIDPRLSGFDRVANSILYGVARLRESTATRRIRRSAEEMGVSGQSPPMERFAFTSRQLDDHSALATTWKYVGLSPYSAPAEWWEFDGGSNRDSLLVTWGSGRVGGELTLLQKLIPVLDEFAASHRVVVQSSDPKARELLATGLANRPSVIVQSPNRDPQYEEYQRALLVIGHGGYGTINESVAFGAPVLILPETVADRMETARRVMHGGVGRTINRYATSVELLRQAVADAMTSSEIAAATERVGADLRDRRAMLDLVGELQHAMDAQ